MAFQTYSRDLRFILFEQLDLGRLFSTPRYSEVTQDLAEMIVNEADKFAVNVLAPINKEGDKVGAKHTGTGVTVPDSFKAAWAKQGEAGWLGLTGNPEFGGQGLPFSLKLAVDDLFFSANTSFALTGSLCMAATGVIDEFGADWMKKAFLERIFT
ncbi:acyl-CoA dehydrogenase family protein, partial [bacterium]|nr:acyl-CoA dehydrogenase family protein [bacterium]